MKSVAITIKQYFRLKRNNKSTKHEYPLEEGIHQYFCLGVLTGYVNEFLQCLASNIATVLTMSLVMKQVYARDSNPPPAVIHRTDYIQCALNYFYLNSLYQHSRSNKRRTYGHFPVIKQLYSTK